MSAANKERVKGCPVSAHRRRCLGLHESLEAWGEVNPEGSPEGAVDGQERASRGDRMFLVSKVFAARVPDLRNSDKPP